jgi:primosomal protein N' (replication factor Y)
MYLLSKGILPILAENTLNDLIDVAVPMPVYQTYTYRVPPQFKGIVKVGMRVLVPFNRRQVTAYVLGAGEPLPETTPIKSIKDVLDAAPLFPGTMVAFLRWAADYYLHPIGEVIQTALPGGLTVEEQSVYQLTDSGRRMLEQPGPDACADRLLRFMDGSIYRYAQLRQEAGKDFSRAKLNAWVEKGWVERRTVLSTDRIGPKTQRFVALLLFDRQRANLSPQRQKLVEILENRGPLSMAELKVITPTAASLVRAMARDCQVTIEERTVYRDPL